MDLSVVIPAKNVGATLPAQLDALLAQQWDGEWEIVVVDNASTDDTAAIARRYAARDPRVRVVPATSGRGVSYVRNTGIEAARADRVSICDGDDIVGDRWVAAMGDALRDHECVTGPIEVGRLNPAWLLRTRGVFEADRPRTFHGVFPSISGGNVGLHRSLWERAGRFDETVFGNEDVEFSLRLFQMGVPVQWEPDAVVHYRYRTETRALWRQGRFYGACRPYICRRLRDAGLPTPPRFAGWKSWVMLVVWLPRLVTREGRASWVWVAGNRLGQVEGCIRNRVLYL